MTRRTTSEASSRATILSMAREIAGLKKRVNGLARPRLVNASIENTGLNDYDADGQLSAIIGRQWDEAHGVVTVAGPPPPSPAALTGEAKPTGVLVTWGGDWADGGATVATSDHKLVEIHGADNAALSGLLFSTLRGEIGSARGGQVLIPWPPDVPLYVRAVARTIPGKATVGPVSGPFLAAKVTQDAIDVDWESLGGTQVFYTEPGAPDPVTDKIGDLWYETVILPNAQETYTVHRWTGLGGWVPVADQGVGEALLMAEAADAAAADRALFFTQDDAPTGLGAADVAIWVDTNDGNRSWSWSGTAWVSRRISNGAIEPNSLVASSVIATGTVTAALLEAVLVLASTVVAGPLTADHVEMDGGGLRFYAMTPDGVAQSGGFATGDDGVTLTDPVTGQTQSSLTREGIAIQTASVSGVDTTGDGLIDSGFSVYGREFLDWINELPRGVVAEATYFPADGTINSGITASKSVGELSFTALAGRKYHVSFDGMALASSAGRIRALVQMRGTENGATPTMTNGVTYQSRFVNLAVTNEAIGSPAFNFYKTWSMTQDVEVRLLVAVSRFNGDTAGSTISVRTYTPDVANFTPVRWTIADAGGTVTDTFLTNDGEGDTNSGGTASPNPKKRYTTAWKTSWHASYYGSGVKRTDTNHLMQGFTSYFPSGGIQRGLAAFTGGADYGSPSEIGKTVVQAIGSATVEKVEVKLKCVHSYSNSGGTASLGYHGQFTEPATAPTAAYDILTRFFRKGETKWVTLPSATWADWKNANYRGITTGPTDDTGAASYMRFAGAGNDAPVLRITYTR